MTAGGLVAELVRVRILEAPLDEVVPMSFSALRARRVCLVEVHAGGAVGVGESWVNYPDWVAAERLATLCDGAAPVVLGCDVSEPARVHARLVEALRPLGRQWGAPGPIWQAISGIDLAVWDLAGRVRGRPVSALLGGAGVRTRVPAYGSGVGPTDVEALCRQAVEAGLPAIKVKVGFGRERDTATLEAARAASGPGMRIFADANQAWDLDEAVRMCGLLREYAVEWVEEPLDGDDPELLAQLVDRTGLPVSTGENVYCAGSFTPYVASGALAQIQPDVCKAGGLTVARQVVEAARTTRTRVSPHCYGGAVGIAASLQLARAYDEVEWIELDVRPNPLRTRLLREPVRIEDGGLVVPGGPGLGSALDPVTVDRFQVAERERGNR